MLKSLEHDIKCLKTGHNNKSRFSVSYSLVTLSKKKPRTKEKKHMEKRRKENQLDHWFGTYSREFVLLNFCFLCLSQKKKNTSICSKEEKNRHK